MTAVPTQAETVMRKMRAEFAKGKDHGSIYTDDGELYLVEDRDRDGTLEYYDNDEVGATTYFPFTLEFLEGVSVACADVYSENNPLPKTIYGTVSCIPNVR